MPHVILPHRNGPLHRGGLVGVRQRIHVRAEQEEIPGVIDGHEDDRESSKDIDGGEPVGALTGMEGRLSLARRRVRRGHVHVLQVYMPG